jgi:prepilin-type N-terminal cleavage/methylation domain-containing protein
MTTSRRARRRIRLKPSPGFTLIELLIIVSVIAILTAIAIPFYTISQARSRTARAEADARAIGSAVSIYVAHMGTPPATLADLTSATVNEYGQSVGPFLPRVPTPPSGWTGYLYTSATNNTFTITASGDGQTVSLP